MASRRGSTALATLFLQKAQLSPWRNTKGIEEREACVVVVDGVCGEWEIASCLLRGDAAR